MSRVAYVDGAYVPLSEACVSVEDRGFQFSDGVYEVWGVFGGKLADAEDHLARLERSLAMLRIEMPASPAALMAVVKETRRRNRIKNGLVYMQVTRGEAPRDHAFPPADVAPTVVVTARPLDLRAWMRRGETGVSVVTTPDIRWARCDIKSVSLLPNVLAKQEAREKGAFEAWLIDRDGFVTEGSSSTAWIVDRDGRLITRPLAHDILPGITRARLIGMAKAMGREVVERKFTAEEAKSAREAFLTSASGLVTPVIAIDGASIGNGHPGEATQALRDAYLRAIGD